MAQKNFFKKLGALDGNFQTANQTFQLPVAAGNLKFQCVGGDMEFSLDGGNTVHGYIKPGDGMVSFEGMETAKISVREASGAVTEARIWAW